MRLTTRLAFAASLCTLAAACGESVTEPLRTPQGANPIINGTATGSSFGNVGALLVDFDGNGKIDPLTDGIMLMRAFFGMTGSSVTNNALGVGATRVTWPEIRVFLNANCGTSFTQ